MGLMNYDFSETYTKLTLPELVKLLYYNFDYFKKELYLEKYKNLVNNQLLQYALHLQFKIIIQSYVNIHIL